MTEKAVPLFFDLSKEVVIELSHGMTFGRNKDCDYTVVDHRVSGSHFKIVIKDKDVFIVDLESSNKTKLNDEVVSANKEIKLSAKDHIRFGEQHFYYSYEVIEDFVIPDITRTLTISNTADIVDDMITEEASYKGIHLSTSTNKKKSQLSELKKSKALVDEHEIALKSVLNQIEERDSVINAYDSLMKKIKNSKEELMSTDYLDKTKLADDCKNFNFSIQELNQSIAEAQSRIEAWKRDIELLQTKVEEVKRIELIHTCLAKDQIVEQDLSTKVEEFRELYLDDKKDQLQKLLKKEFDNYKYLQEGYSDSLKYKKSRLDS